MKTNHEFELITDKTSNFKAFIIILSYRAPHIHLDYEVGIILNGDLTVRVGDRECTLYKGDVLCINPCQIHEFKSSKQATLLMIQVNPSYFKRTYPLMQNIQFSQDYLRADQNDPRYLWFRNQITNFAKVYIKKEEHYELRCSGLLNLIFYDLLELIPYREVSSIDRNSARTKADRVRRIADYIEDNYSEKIKLSDLAALEDITETHLSHFFTENFNMPFQEYLMKLRCEKARAMLLRTDLSLFDISFSCGFSDPKYLNKAFFRQYNCSPKDYRSNFGRERLENQQASMLTTQQILSDKTSLIILDRYFNANL